MSTKRFLKTAHRKVDAVIERAESDSHTIKILWSTGFKGLRSEWGEKFYEALEMTADAVNLTRINSGNAPFLTEHERNTQVQLGVIQKAWLEDGMGFAEVKLSKNRNQEIIQDILDGILSNVSVGYSIERLEETGKENGIPVLTARKWTPIEISLVATPFDPQATVLRSSDSEETECEINSQTLNREKEMTPEEIEKLKADAVAEYKAQLELEAKEKADKEEADRKALEEIEAKAKAEKEASEERSAQLEMQVRSAGFDEETTKEMIGDFKARNLNSNQIANEIIEKLKGKKSSPVKGKEMTKRELAIAALLNRVDAKRFKVDRENPFKQTSFVKIIEGVVERNAGESDAAFVKRATVTSDLPELLSSVANKLMGEDGAEKFTYHRFCGHQSMKDFRSTPIIQLSGVVLAAKTEGGSYATATLVDSNEMIQLEERGILIDISQKAIVNDDLGALKALPARAQSAGHRDIESRMYALLASNSGNGPTLSDSKALFHVDHNNILVAAGGPTVANLASANLKMAAFQDDSGQPLDLRTKYIVCGPDFELIAKQTASAIMVPNSSTSVNPYAGEVEVVVSSRVTANYWYAVADKEELAALVYGTQEGMDQPNVETEVDFKSSNLQTKIEFPNAVAAANSRGIVRVKIA